MPGSPLTEMPKMPQHVAFIMDGNGRWAKSRGMPRLEGHRRGIDTVREMMDAAIEMGIGCVTFYAFSTENWQRPEEEVRGLMDLMRLYFKKEIKTLSKKGIRLKFIGDRTPEGRLSRDILNLMNEAEEETADNNELTAVFAINYSGRDELVRAAAYFAEDVEQIGRHSKQMNEQVLSEYLDTVNLPELDMLVRTGGEQRLSNFMLWQAAYAELFFEPKFWPDYHEDDFRRHVALFSQRDRRFGGLNDGEHKSASAF